jgi:hypothetical protein
MALQSVMFTPTTPEDDEQPTTIRPLPQITTTHEEGAA